MQDTQVFAPQLDLLNNIQGETLFQIGFVLAKAAWGRGVGTEMAAAVLRYGFVDLGLPRVVASAPHVAMALGYDTEEMLEG